MKTRAFITIIVIIILCSYAVAFANDDTHSGFDSSNRVIADWGITGWGNPGWGSGFGNRTATPKPTATPTPIPLTEDTYAIEKIAKSVYMLEVIDAQGNFLGSGSGFLAFNNYTLVTNYHVIDQGAVIKAYSDEGYEYELASVVVADEDKDIAILQFASPVTAKPLSIDKNQRISRGEKVLAIGSPMGIKNTVTTGTITNVTSRHDMTYYQFSAPISSGNSGGALLNDKGYVLGVTTSTLVSTESAVQNMNFAIPISYVIDLYNNPTSVPIPVSSYFSKDNSNNPIKINIQQDCTVLFSWDATMFTNNGDYIVTIEEINGLYRITCNETNTYLEWASVPDYSYKVTVSNGKEQYSNEFTVKANTYPVKRYYSADSISIRAIKNNKSNKIDSLQKSEIIELINDSESVILICNEYLGTSAVATKDFYTFVIKSPSHGFCKLTKTYTTNAFDRTYWNEYKFEIIDLMKNIFLQSNYEVGDYIYQLYINGYLVAQSDYLIY